MPQRNTSRRLVLRLLLFALAGRLLWALGRDGAKPSIGEPETVSTAVPEGPDPTRARTKESRFSKRRLATTLAFTTLFFAGAAFSAGAGDLVAGALEGATDTTATSTETAPDESSDPATTEDQGVPSDEESEPASEPAPSEDQPAEPADDDSNAPPAEQPADEQSADEQTADEQGDAPADDNADDPGESSSEPAPGDNPAGDDEPSSDESDAGAAPPAHGDYDGPADTGSDDAGLTSAEAADPELEFDGAGYGIVWLHRTLPDPTPPAKRLDPAFARALVRASSSHHVDWALVLGVLRASGHKERWPASERTLNRLAGRLSTLRADADEWQAALAFAGRTSFADRTIALTRYNRAVGLRALVRGLEAEKAELEQRVLADPRLDIYPGGRDDVAGHRINVRVLVLMLYLAECHGQVTVSSLESGHRLYARPGVVSAHMSGLAVDVAALGGVSVLGHQQAGSVTERAVRNILLLPAELRPQQIISLLGLGGPSFPLADHYDHIHIGY